ncbi:MAG: nucleotidyltransferase domain-containing protein [Cyanobium sp.]
MPVRLLRQSLLRWPEASEVLEAVSTWAAELGAERPGLERVGVHGSYGRGDAGFGSDLDLVLTPAEWQELISLGESDPARSAFARALQRDCRWLWSRQAAVETGD